MFYILAAIWGLGQGALISNLLGVVYDFCGAEQLSILFGLILLFEGVGGLSGVPLCGKFSLRSTKKNVCSLTATQILLNKDCEQDHLKFEVLN